MCRMRYLLCVCCKVQRIGVLCFSLVIITFADEFFMMRVSKVIKILISIDKFVSCVNINTYVCLFKY